MQALIVLLLNALSTLIIVHVVLSYFMSPNHPFRQTIDRMVEPMLAPLRQIIPSMGGLDFSPLILIFFIRFLSRLFLNSF